MIHSDDDYPYHHDEVPSLKKLLQVVDWDVVCVFDACRWDAFEEMCGESEPVRAPGSNTPTWTQQVWCDPDADWADVTYISSNPLTTKIRDDESRGGVIEDHVGEYVEAWSSDSEQCVWSHRMRTADPWELSKLAKQYDPPMVLHYMQPHTPFVGEVTLGVQGKPEEFPAVDLKGFQRQTDLEYHMVLEGLVTPEYARLAYLKNLEFVWDASRRIRKRYDRVITTADHGEELGPDNWDHGGPHTPQSRVVPFHTNTDFITHDELPARDSLGAEPGSDWVTI